MLIYTDTKLPACRSATSACRGGRLPCPTPLACRFISARPEPAHAESEIDDTPVLPTSSPRFWVPGAFALGLIAFIVWAVFK